jgi:hypothetical protein
MIDQVLSALSTLAWLVFTVSVVVLFGRSEGGGWSIAGGVARGVRDWSRERRAALTRSSSPFSGTLPPMHIPATPVRRRAAREQAAPKTPSATVEDLGDRPIH